MPTIFPTALAPAFSQRGQTLQRMSAVTFINQSDITPALNLPRNIGATTISTDPFAVAGFNTFMVLIDVLTANITFKLNIINPQDQATILFTRSIVTVVAGSGFNVIPFGFGNAAGSGGVDVYYYVSFSFTGAGANATINQFPGLWGCVR